MSERIDSRLIGVERWHVGVSMPVGTGRRVMFTIEFHERAGMEPISLVLDPVDARQIGAALARFADQASWPIRGIDELAP